MTLSRRDALITLAGAAMTPAMARAAADDSLAAVARSRGLLYGSSIAREALTDAAYGDLYRREAAIVTTDYALKFDALRPHSPEADFGGADALINFAAENKLAARGHALIWNENLPAWMRVLSRREIERLFDRHIEETVTRYADRLHSWDVVNEPIWPDHGAARGFRRGVWYDALGASYVRQAFRRAARFDRQAKLTLNEAWCERSDAFGQTVRRHLLDLIDDLRDADAPLHAIGLQGHLQPRFDASDESFVEFLHKLAQRKLDIYITELDVDDSGYDADVAKRDQQVAQRYESFLRHALSVPAVKVVITWQMADRFSWYRDPGIAAMMKFTRPARPLPFDDQLRRKPAWSAMARAFQTRRIA